MVEALGGETISASTVSSMISSRTASLDASLAAWRARPLTAKAYPDLVGDAPVERGRREGRAGQVRSTAQYRAVPPCCG